MSSGTNLLGVCYRCSQKRKPDAMRPFCCGNKHVNSRQEGDETLVRDMLVDLPSDAARCSPTFRRVAGRGGVGMSTRSITQAVDLFPSPLH